MFRTIVFITGFISFSIGLLIWYVSQGSVAAAMVLGGLIVLILRLLEFSMVELSENRRAKREQVNFLDNAKENLAIMMNSQKVLNSQSQQLLRQAKQLPAGQETVFDINDYVDDLDSMEIEGL
jgi:hypothetical protein